MDKIRNNIGSVVAIFLVIGLLYLLISNGNEIKSAGNEIELIETEIDQLNDTLVYLKGYEQNFDEMMSLLEKYSATIPEKKDEAEIISTFNTLAKDNDLTMSEILFKETKTEGKLLRVPLFIRLKGGYFELNDFIDQSDKTGRIYNISKIGIRRESDTETIIADIDLNTFTIVK